jgi:hypothetical protein
VSPRRTSRSPIEFVGWRYDGSECSDHLRPNTATPGDQARIAQLAERLTDGVPTDAVLLAQRHLRGIRHGYLPLLIRFVRSSATR